MRFCAFGDLGSGKTICIVKEALRYHRKHPLNKIYSNIELLTIPYVPIDSASAFFEIEKSCFVLLDELWHLADSRKSMAVINDVLSMLLLRSRKRDWVVGYSQQWYTQTDIRIRFITDVWIEPQFLKGRILREDIYDKHASFLATRFYDGTKFFDDFDTYADPFTLNVKDLKALWDLHMERRLRRR